MDSVLERSHKNRTRQASSLKTAIRKLTEGNEENEEAGDIFNPPNA
jgi:hypothetical protein